MIIKIFKSLFLKVHRNLYRHYRKLFCEEIIVIGDSHANVFNHNLFLHDFPGYVFSVCSVGGATVSGLENPNSKTQALPLFINCVKKSKAKIIILLLGEVDTGFVIWYRAEKYKTQVSKYLDKAWDNYQQLLSMLSKTHQVVCISTPLPTIRDGQDWGEIANARKNVKATQLQRTKLTIEFNNGMRNFCEKNTITYLSFDEEAIGKDGLVNSSLLSENPNDHHYAMNVYAEIIITKLKQCIEQIN